MSGLPIKTKSINGREYETTLLDAVSSRPVFLRFAKLLGSGAGAAGEKIAKGSIAAALAGGAGLVERISDDDWSFFVKVFGERSTVQLDGGNRVSIKDVYAMHFANKTKEELQWLFFCLGANYSDFLGDAGSEVGEVWDMIMTALLPTSSPSSSPKESTGGSGDSSQTSAPDSPSST